MIYICLTDRTFKSLRHPINRNTILVFSIPCQLKLKLNFACWGLITHFLDFSCIITPIIRLVISDSFILQHLQNPSSQDCNTCNTKIKTSFRMVCLVRTRHQWNECFNLIWPWFLFRFLVNKMFWAQESYGQWTAMIPVSGQQQRPVTALSWLSGVTPGPAQRGGNERKSAECWPYMIPRAWWLVTSHQFTSPHDAWESGRSETHDWSADERVNLNAKQNTSWVKCDSRERLNEFELDTPCLWNLVSECKARTRRVGR